MNKRTFSIASLIIIIALSLYGFSKYRSTDTLDSTPVEISKTVETSSLGKKLEDKNDFYDISIQYPVEVLDKNQVIESFVTSKFVQKKEDWKIGGLVYTAEKVVQKNFPDRSKMKYEYSVTYKKYESKKWNTTSYVFTTYEFVGGANGNITVNTFTFNKDGILAIDTILDMTKGKDIELSRLLESALIARGGENASKDMIRDGLGLSYLKADGKTIDLKKCNCDGFLFTANFQNFVVEDDGLRFLFNKYQVAPGSDGLPEVLMNWNTLAAYTQAPFK